MTSPESERAAETTPSGRRWPVITTATLVLCLAMVGLLTALWAHVLQRDADRREAALDSWLRLEQEIVSGAARATRAWLTERIGNDSVPPTVAELEAVRLFIDPIQLGQDGDAWIYSGGHPVFDKSADFPKLYFGKTMAEIFALQKEKGAHHYDEIVRGVMEATDGTSWYVWLPEKGREFAAWTSVRVYDGTWTIGLSTPEPQILAFFRVPGTFRREVFGAALITALLLGLALVLWLQQNSDARRLSVLRLSHADLERAVAERTQQLEAINRDLTRSNEDLEQFAYAASHDLRAPLRTISSFLGLLRNRYGSALGPDATEFITYSVNGAQRLSEQINGLLDYSRVTTAGQAPTPVHLDPLLDGALENVRGLIEDTCARIERPADLPTVLADGSQITTLFQNLIGNALKYRHPERVPEIAVTVEPDGAFHRIEVSDNGIGIAPEFQGRIFGVFQRLHGPAEFEGTGIGLALCKRIVERHGGTLSVRSDGRTGSVFMFTLPAVDAAAAGGPDPAGPAEEQRPQTVTLANAQADG